MGTIDYFALAFLLLSGFLGAMFLVVSHQNEALETMNKNLLKILKEERDERKN